MKVRVSVIVFLSVLVMGACAQAVPITLTDSSGPNSTVMIDPLSQSGIFNWIVDGSDQMFQAAYWYRTTTTGVASPVSSLTWVSTVMTGTNEATVNYTGTDFNLQIDYTLYGSDVGSGSSDIHQIVMVTNKTTSVLGFHLFGYFDFDLNGTAPGETASRADSSTIEQVEGTAEGSVSVNPNPSHWEIGGAAALLARLSNPAFTNLLDAASPYTGDAAFAFQWDASIARNGSWSTSPELQVSGLRVPEPYSAMALVTALGALPLLWRRRR